MSHPDRTFDLLRIEPGPQVINVALDGRLTFALGIPMAGKIDPENPMPLHPAHIGRPMQSGTTRAVDQDQRDASALRIRATIFCVGNAGCSLHQSMLALPTNVRS